jgi:Zn-dependent M28 family amino/carboxypeptidase
MNILRMMTVLAAGWITLLAFPANADTASSQAWHRQVAAISAGDSTATRGLAITDQLDALGIAWHTEPFEIEGQSGQNLVADVGGKAEAPLLLIGAHYDRVDKGQGATDNASGSATALALAAALHAKPLQNHRVQVVFWDLEEKGLLGSRAWVATPEREKPALYVNFDVFGWGDTLWMMAPTPDEPLATLLSAQSKAAGLNFSAGDKYPPTDHLAFLKAGWPAVSFSLVGSDEIDLILQVFSGQKPDSMPKVMQVIHSARDTVDELDADDVPLALQVLASSLRQWDARTQSHLH